MKKLFLLSSLLWLSLTATAETGSFVYEFLQLPTSVQAASAGGQTVSSPECDLGLALHNPACLNGEMHHTAQVGYLNYLADIHFGQAIYSRKISELQSWMAAVRYLDYGEVEGADAYGRATGTLPAKDMALTGGYAFQLADQWRGGINAHLIYSVLDSYTSLGMGVDLGVHYRDDGRGLWAGLAVKNLGAQLIAYDDSHEALPWDIQAGLTKQLEHAPFRFTLTAWGFNRLEHAYYGYDDSAEKWHQKALKHLLIGVDIVPADNFQIYLGYNYRRRLELAVEQRSLLSGMSAGFSLNVKKVRIGASYAQYSAGGSSLQMSLALDLNRL